jgi:phosphoserine phosphatase
MMARFELVIFDFDGTIVRLGIRWSDVKNCKP